MPGWTPRHPRAATLAVSAVLWAAFFAVMGPRYATNDDPLMAMLAAGAGFVSSPDEHLVFTNAAVGLALAALYRRAGSVPWYALYLLAAQVLGVAAVIHLAMRAGPSPARAGLLAAFLAVAAVPFANNLHFTVAAVVAGQAGILLLAGHLLGATPGPGGLAAAAGLLVLAALIRMEALLLVLALGLPTLAVLAARAERRTIARAAGALAASVALAGAAWAFDRVHDARDPAWSAYRAFNASLRPFVDFGRADEYGPSAEALRAAGWSRNDHRLLLHWFHPDADVVNTETLRAVAARLSEPADSPGTRLRQAAARLFANRTALPILLAWPFALAAAAGAGRARAALLAALAATLAVLAWLAVFRKTPPHLYLPALAWPLALAAALPVEPPARGRAAAHVVFVFTAVLAAVAGLRALAFQVQESREGRAREAAYDSALAPLREPPDRVPVLWATFPYHVADPLRPAPAWPAARFVALGWPQRTPAAEAALRAGGHADLWQALLDPRVRLVAPVEAARWIEQYAARHRGLSLRLVQEASVPGFGVFRAAGAPGPPTERVLRSGAAVPE
jgi:hypothetical protein